MQVLNSRLPRPPEQLSPEQKGEPVSVNDKDPAAEMNKPGGTQ